MSKKLQIFKCESCGSMVEAIRPSGCDPSCCDAPMKALAENSTDAAKEKHVPVIEPRDGGTFVRVGSAAHPMEAEHYIEWIELVAPAADGEASAAYRAFLKPGDKPEAFFPIAATGVRAREHCNKHGLWKA